MPFEGTVSPLGLEGRGAGCLPSSGGRGGGWRRREGRCTSFQNVNSRAVQLTFLGGGHRSRPRRGGEGVSASPSEVPIVLCLANEIRWERSGGRREAGCARNCLPAPSRGAEGSARVSGGASGRRGPRASTAASAPGAGGTRAARELGPDRAGWPPRGRARGPRAPRSPDPLHRAPVSVTSNSLQRNGILLLFR